MSYADIIKKKQREWEAPDLMNGANMERSEKTEISACCFFLYGGIWNYILLLAVDGMADGLSEL